MLQHAEGDEVVPVILSRALHDAARGSRFIEVPGGHHRSVQHDPELQAATVRFLLRAAQEA
jgi:pimeloyl-ACP methyl ester carboxylesterase